MNIASKWTSFFAANDITTDTKKLSIFLSSCGQKCYTLLRSLLSPTLPSSLTFDQLTKALKTHQHPPPSVTMERFNFYKRDRKPGESIAQYVACLRKLCEYCQFGESLNDMIRDRLVCGVNEDIIQQRLLSEATLTLDTALKLATSHEQASKNLESLKTGRATGDTLQMDTSNFRKQSEKKECFRCGADHSSDTCRFRSVECNYCHKKGHIASVCYKRARANKNKSSKFSSTNQINTDSHDPPAEDINSIYKLNNTVRVDPIKVKVLVNGVRIEMEVDTGASFSIVNRKTFDFICGGTEHVELQHTNLKFRTFTGEVVPAAGMVETLIEYGIQSVKLKFYVVDGKRPCLMGRDWLQHLKLDWNSIFRVEGVDNSIQHQFVSEFPKVFEKSLGTMKDAKAHIHLHPDATPKYCKPRPVPYSLMTRIETELDRLVELGILEPVDVSDWAAPIVPIVKSDNSIRICGDYKVTVNQAAKLDNYPIPKADDLYTKLVGGQKFTKLDLSQAYQQMVLDDESRQCLTINTHKGLFRPMRLAFGVSSAPGIFQREMEKRLAKVPFTVVRVDDVLISGENDEAHIQNVRTVLNIMLTSGLRLRQDNCKFMLDEVVYLGMLINKDGMRPVPEKIEAVRASPPPTNVSELKSFLGMLNYYQRYIPNSSAILEPLHRLLRKEVQWIWGPAERKSFEKAKNALTSDSLLVHYDSRKELLLSADASPYGVGVVLSHVFPDGSDKPIAYASRSLSAAERNYSHLEKEALAIIFGVRKFHQYCYGRKFIISSDHKPLVGIFGQGKAIPEMTAARLQRWALILSAYDYSFIYKPGSLNANADGLSRLPLQRVDEVDLSLHFLPEEYTNDVLMMELDHAPITAIDVKRWSSRDPLLSKVISAVRNGFHDIPTTPEWSPYNSRRDELHVIHDCLLWGSRVVVPPQGREAVLAELHQCHPGMSRMKQLARSYVWWPNLDADIEQTVRNCSSCQKHRRAPNRAPIHPWEWARAPWKRIHIDYAGPYHNRMFLVIVDSYSKWLDVIPTTGSTSTTTIKHLRNVFATHGLPEVIVNDNGTAFVSEEFKQFLRKNGIQQVTSAPYHPSSNGQAERYVQTFKRTIEKMDQRDISTALARFLLSYRSTPQTTTNVSPAELLMGRRLTTALDLLKPSLERRSAKHQNDMTSQGGRRIPEFYPHDLVWVFGFSRGQWLPGTIERALGNVMYEVKLHNGTLVKRHVEQMRHQHTARPQNPVITPNLAQPIEIETSPPLRAEDSVPTPIEPSNIAPIPLDNVPPRSPAPPPAIVSSPVVNTSYQPNQPSQESSVPSLVTSRPVRSRRPPKYLKDYDCS